MAQTATTSVPRTSRQALISRARTASGSSTASTTENDKGAKMTERLEMPDATPEMIETPEFKAVWECIKKWDINVPDAYGGYCRATGSPARALHAALAAGR